MCKRSNEWIHIAGSFHLQSMEQNNTERPVDIKQSADNTDPPFCSSHESFMNTYQFSHLLYVMIPLMKYVGVYFWRGKKRARHENGHIQGVISSKTKDPPVVNLLIASIIWLAAAALYPIPNDNYVFCCLARHNPRRIQRLFTCTWQMLKRNDVGRLMSRSV